jgi:hypothetical protein
LSIIFSLLIPFLRFYFSLSLSSVLSFFHFSCFSLIASFFLPPFHYFIFLLYLLSVFPSLFPLSLFSITFRLFLSLLMELLGTEFGTVILPVSGQQVGSCETCEKVLEGLTRRH